MASIDIEKLLDAIRMKESGGNPRAVSPKGAKGAYQFMPETAKEFGLADPFNEQASREAAKRKMLGLLGEFGGSPELAIAAYNMGQGNLRKNKLDYTRVPETNNYVKGIMGMLGKPIQVADSGQIMSDAPQPGLQPTPQQEQPVPEYDMSGILGAYNEARQRKPAQQATVQQDTSGFNDPKTMGLLALGLQMMGNSRGQSFGESLAGGGMAGLNTMAGVNQGNQEQLQAQQEQQQALMEQQAQQQQLIQQQAQQEALQSIPPEVLQDHKQLAGIMMKLGMHKEALAALQQANRPPPGIPTGFTANPDGSIAPMPIAGGGNYQQYQTDLATGKAQALANIVSPVQQHSMANQDQQLELQKQRFLVDQAEAERKARDALNPKKSLTESQAKATTFASQMQSASNVIDSIERAGFDPSSIKNQAEIGLAGGLTNIVAPKEAQSYKQAQNQWAESFLRVKTGAAATKSEIDMNVKTFFPQIGDSKEVIAQKAQARMQAERDTLNMAGSGKDLATPRNKQSETATYDPDAMRKKYGIK